MSDGRPSGFSVGFIMGIFTGIAFSAVLVSSSLVDDDNTITGEPIHKLIEQCEADLPRNQRCVVTAIVEEK